MPRWPLTPRERFEQTINKQDNGCWMWSGCSKKCGANMIYGITYLNRKTEYAHRASYILYRGNIPNGMQINHHCDIPLCVNPDHLYAGTHQDNMNDVRDRNRRANVPKRYGEANSNSKITKEQANDIQCYYQSGVFTQQALADMYGISQNRVSHIVRNNYLLEV